MFQTSSYCRDNPLLRQAEPEDLQVVCGTSSVGDGAKEGVVLTVTKIIPHPTYTREGGPERGHDISVYIVDDSQLELNETTVYPACLPKLTYPDDSLSIFSAWRAPEPLYRRSGSDEIQTIRKELYTARHTRMTKVNPAISFKI